MEIRRTNIDEIFYYHPNHLGSSSFVTDQNQTITQGFLYAPFGEITTEYNINFGFSVIPKYSFNAKELDEETGMYYYEARYYAPPTFTSRDPLFEKYFWMSPYAYCNNNPVALIDPDGRFPIGMHKKIVTDAINYLSITDPNRYSLLANPTNHGNIRFGVGNYADIANYPNPAIHFDGKVGFQSCVSHWNNVSNSLSKSYNNNDFVSFGRDLHTVADFYAHSNYVELYVSYYTDVLKMDLENFDINSIPTFDDALADPKLSQYLKDNKLRTGYYGKGTDPSSETHHNRMNKDKPTSERGRKRINSKYTLYDAALNVANRSTRQKMEGVTE